MAHTMRNSEVRTTTIKVPCEDPRIPAKRAAARELAAAFRALGVDAEPVMRRGHAPVVRIRSYS